MIKVSKMTGVTAQTQTFYHEQIDGRMDIILIAITMLA